MNEMFISIPTVYGNASLLLEKFTTLKCCIPQEDGMLLMFDDLNIVTVSPQEVQKSLEKVVKADKTSIENKVSKHLTKILNKNIRIAKNDVLRFKITFDDLDSPMVSTSNTYNEALNRFLENNCWMDIKGFEGTAEVEISIAGKQVLLNVSGFISNSEHSIEQSLFTHSENMALADFISKYWGINSFLFDKNKIMVLNNCELKGFSLNGFYLYDAYSFTTTTSNFITENAEVFRQAKMSRELKQKQIQKDYEGRIAISNALAMVASAISSQSAATAGLGRATISASVNINRGTRGLSPK